MRYFLIILVFTAFGCKKKDAPTPIDKTVGISVSGEYTLYLLNNAGEEITFEVDSKGEVSTDEPENLTSVAVKGSAEIDAEKLFSTIPNIAILSSQEGATIFGDISNFPSSMFWLDVDSGSLTGAPQFGELLEGFRIGRGHDVEISMQSLPPSIRVICTNSGNVTGVIGTDFPQSLERFVVHGDSDVGGDYGLIPGNFPETFGVKGLNEINSYTSRSYDNSRLKQFRHTAIEGYGFDSNTIDDILCSLVDATWVGNKVIELSGAHAKPSNASTNCIIKLEQKGVKVITN